MTFTARASLKKRSTIFLSAENCWWRNLMATREPIPGLEAAQVETVLGTVEDLVFIGVRAFGAGPGHGISPRTSGHR
jgi:hypothetical protein